MNDLYNLFFITIQMFIPFLISVALPPLQENDLKSTYYNVTYLPASCKGSNFLLAGN